MSWEVEEVERLLRDAQVEYDLAKAQIGKLTGLRPPLQQQKVDRALGKIAALQAVLMVLR